MMEAGAEVVGEVEDGATSGEKEGGWVGSARRERRREAGAEAVWEVEVGPALREK